MKCPHTVVVRILTAIHTALGRWLGLLDPPAAVVKGKTNRGSSRARTRKPSRKGGNQHTAESARPTERKRYSWFDCDPDAVHAALPGDPEDEEAEAWARAHNLPVRR